MRTFLRRTAVVVLVVYVLIWLILLVAGLPGRLALVRDNGMEPTVPQGAVMIIPDVGGHKVGDVVAWWPNDTRYRIEGPLAIFGIFDDARPARVAPRQGSVTITFDNRPDQAPVVVQEPGRVHDRMSAYLPFLGYLLWPGPVGLALIFIAAIVVLYLTRQRRASTTG
jgi:hypothetical protein